MRRRGFTLIELTVVIVILTMVLGPFLFLAVSTYRQFKSIAMTAGLKTASDHAGYAVLRVVAHGGDWHLDDDNHGVTCADGSRAWWQPPNLIVTQHGVKRQIALQSVTDLNMLRHGSTLTVNVTVQGPQHPGGPPITSHSSYDYPAEGELK